MDKPPKNNTKSHGWKQPEWTPEAYRIKRQGATHKVTLGCKRKISSGANQKRVRQFRRHSSRETHIPKKNTFCWQYVSPSAKQSIRLRTQSTKNQYALPPYSRAQHTLHTPQNQSAKPHKERILCVCVYVRMSECKAKSSACTHKKGREQVHTAEKEITGQKNLKAEQHTRLSRPTTTRVCVQGTLHWAPCVWCLTKGSQPLAKPHENKFRLVVWQKQNGWTRKGQIAQKRTSKEKWSYGE